MVPEGGTADVIASDAIGGGGGGVALLLLPPPQAPRRHKLQNHSETGRYFFMGNLPRHIEPRNPSTHTCGKRSRNRSRPALFFRSIPFKARGSKDELSVVQCRH